MRRNKVFIIAEAGINHNGSFVLAKKLVNAAKKAGADAVKFQTFTAKNVILKKAKKLSYQKKNNKDKETQLQLLKKLELKKDEFVKLKKYCKLKKIEFMSTPKDLESAKFLNKLGVRIFKIGSGDILNKELLKYLGRTKKKIILSTGLANIKEIDNAFKFFGRKKNIFLLHCVSLYPTPDNLANLNSIKFLKKKFKVICGFSDHTLGINISLASIAKGAQIVEKHITLNKKMKGPDHKISLNPIDFAKLVNGIRQIEKSFGKFGKVISNNEKKNIKKFRRGLYFSKNIKKDHIILHEDIAVKRPLLGLDPTYKETIIGKKLKKNVSQDQPIKFNLFK